MRFAICNETFQDWPWDKSLEMSLQYGYTGWEIAPFTLGEHPDQLSTIQRSAMAEQIRKSGIEVVGLHWLLAKTSGFHLTTNDVDVRNKTARYLSSLAELCRDLGGSIMVLGSPQQRNFPPEMTYQQANANAIETLEQVLPTLEKHEVTIALEPLGPAEGNFWNKASDAVEVIKQIGSKHIQLHLDVKAMSSEPTPISQIIRDNQSYTAHFHANDPNLLGPGMGDVPMGPIFQALIDTNYQGWVSVEVFKYEPGIETILRESMANMKAAISAAHQS